MKDKILNCIQCEAEFLLTGEEQERILARGFSLPRRCPACRRHKAKMSGGNEERRPKGKKRDGWGHKRHREEDVNEW